MTEKPDDDFDLNLLSDRVYMLNNFVVLKPGSNLMNEIFEISSRVKIDLLEYNGGLDPQCVS